MTYKISSTFQNIKQGNAIPRELTSTQEACSFVSTHPEPRSHKFLPTYRSADVAGSEHQGSCWLALCCLPRHDSSLVSSSSPGVLSLHHWLRVWPCLSPPGLCLCPSPPDPSSIYTCNLIFKSQFSICSPLTGHQTKVLANIFTQKWNSHLPVEIKTKDIAYSKGFISGITLWPCRNSS